MCILHELVTKDVFIKIVNCGGGGGDGIDIREDARDTFYPLCGHIRYKKYWVTLCAK